MARTILVAAVTALTVAFGYQTLTKPMEAPPPAAGPTAENADEVLRRLQAIEERLEQLALRTDREPVRLEGRPEIPVSRIEALESRLDALAERTEAIEAPTTEAAKDAGSDAKRDAELDRWIKALHDKNESVAFSAALELGRLKDLRATDPLIATLRHHRDYYVRLAAATALGDIEALDAVPYLIDTLNDKDALVRTAASDALQKVTGHRIDLSPEFDEDQRRAVQETWRTFWKDNEGRLRAD